MTLQRALLLVHSMLFVGISLLNAQNPQLRFNHYKVEDGLTTSDIKSIAQDYLGFMWFGSSDGLMRFDGHEFLNFERSNNKIGGLCGNNIAYLECDDAGFLWVGTADGGVCRMNPKTFEVKKYPTEKQYPEATKTTMCLSVKSSNEVYVGFEKSTFYVLDPQSGKYEMMDDGQSNSKQTMYSVLASKQSDRIYYGPILAGLCWIENGIAGGLDTPPNQTTPGYTINEFLEDEKGNLWYGAWDNALHYYNVSTQENLHFPISDDKIQFGPDEVVAVAKDNLGRIWVGTWNDGLYIFDEKTNRKTKIEESLADYGSFAGTRVKDIYRDRDNRMWIAHNKGISVYDPMLNQFEIYKVKEHSISCFLYQNDTLWGGYDGGICRIEDGETKCFPLVFNGRSLSVVQMISATEGKLLLGTNVSLFEWNIKNERLLPKLSFEDAYKKVYLNLPTSRFSHLSKYKTDSVEAVLAFVYGYQLVVVHPESGKAAAVDIGHFTTDVENLARNFLQDDQDNLWAIGSSKGLMQINTDTLKELLRSYDHGYSQETRMLPLKNWSARGKEGCHLETQDIFDIQETGDGKFWLSTIGGGLYKFDPKAKDCFFEKINCPVNTLRGMSVDNNGNLWIATASGLLHYNTQKLSFKRYGKHEGIPVEGLQSRFYKDEAGTFYMGCEDGYIKFCPSDLEANETVYAAGLTHIEVNSENADSLIERNSSNADYFEFSSDQNYITFKYSAPNYSNPENNKFQHRIKGLEERWHMGDDNQTAEYTSLPSGEYIFELRSSNSDGFEAPMQQLFHFRIKTAWYKSWFAILAYALAIGLIVYGLFRYRLNQVRRVYEVRNSIARDLHDDIGSTLGSISFYSQVVQQQLEGKEKSAVDEIVDKIGNTSREMMSSLGDIVWAVNPKNDSYEKVFDRMKDFASPILSAKKIKFLYSISDKMEDEKLSMIQRRNMFFIFKEVLNNAVKYAECESFTLRIFKNNQGISMQLKDDGIGFDRSTLNVYNGNGLLNMEARAKEMGARIRIDSALESGTVIEVQV